MAMERKATKTIELTREEVKTSLGKARLSAQEERAVRMRFGASVETTAPLARAAGENAELADELLVLEMQLMKAFGPKSKAAPAPAAAVDTRAKDKIVRALRRKK
jgi:hypothetical protein